MNHARVFRVLLAVCAGLTFSQCASGPPPAPGSADYSGVQNLAYRRGYYHGVEDGKLRQEPSHERHHEDYASETETSFERGYALGYEGGTRRTDADPAEDEGAYRRGHETGTTDAEAGRSPFPARYSRNYTTGSESSFHRGYRVGFGEVRARKD